MSDVEEFLASFKPARRCASCRLANADEVNRAVRKFLEMRNACLTSVPFVTFYRHHLKTRLSYPLAESSLRRHIRDCLNEVP